VEDGFGRRQGGDLISDFLLDRLECRDILRYLVLLSSKLLLIGSKPLLIGSKLLSIENEVSAAWRTSLLGRP
jgi:hypothetical protein